jgi:hypothetical protein
VIKSVHHVAGAARHEPERGRFAAVVIASALSWLAALVALIGNLTAPPVLGWGRALWVAALCGASPAALGMTRRAAASRRVRAAVPRPLLERRYHGSLAAITDSERRSLRSVAATAYEVAERTSDLLAELISIPSVRIFRGVRVAGTDLPRMPHVVSSGRQLILLESVAWPSGHYEVTDGRVHCDGTYIGQSARPLLAAVQHWRAALPRHHRVCAVVVVHTGAGSDITLPAPTGGDLAWIRAEDAARDVRQRILSGRQVVSRAAVAALMAAVDGPP